MEHIMTRLSTALITQIRKARQTQHVSQRALSARTNITQSHISLIEKGEVEPGLSSVIELARALELELVLVPKKLLPAIQGMLRSVDHPNEPPRPAYSLDEDDDEN
jgi:transcriptional regulator with XRE-family HTH domain